MFIVYNQSGCLFAIIAGIVGAVFSALMPSLQDIGGTHPALVVAGIVGIIIDFIYRLNNNKYYGWIRFLRPRLGGQILFIPVWIVGILLCFGGPLWEWSNSLLRR